MTGTASGRPIRFFVLLMGGWATIRIASAILDTSDTAISDLAQVKAPATGHQPAQPRLARQGNSANEAPANMPQVKADTPSGHVHGSPPRLLVQVSMTSIARPRPNLTATLEVAWKNWTVG